MANNGEGGGGAIVPAAKPAEIVRFDPARTAEEIRMIFKFSATAMVEIGIRLLAAKEDLNHGEWLPWLETTGLQPRTAQRYMHVAEQMRHGFVFAGATSVAKVQALAELSDDELRELYESKEVRGIQQDEIDRMSASELRRRLRESGDRQARNERQLEKARGRIERAEGRKLPKETAAALSRINKELELGELSFRRIALLVDELVGVDPETVDDLELRRRAMASAVGRLATGMDALYRRMEEHLGAEPMSEKQLRRARELGKNYDETLAAKKPGKKNGKKKG